MITQKNYYFTIMVTEEGAQFPLINFVLKDSLFLNQLVYTQKLQTSTGVKKVLEKIEKVLNSESIKEEVWETEYETPCFVSIEKEESIIGDAYSQDEDLEVKIQTEELKRMFEKWLLFLLKYENNEIPNIKYAFK